MENLAPCPYRHVNDDGRVFCEQLKTGDRTASLRLCSGCPINQIGCSHLRATLVRGGHPPFLVRYGNGRAEIWQDPAPPLAIEQAACAARVIPVSSAQDCSGCTLRHELSMELPMNYRPGQNVRPFSPPPPLIAPVPATDAETQPTRSVERSCATAGNIIQLESWLAQHPRNARTHPRKAPKAQRTRLDEERSAG